MKKRTFLLFATLFSLLTVQAQQYVLNTSLETGPTATAFAQIDNATNWHHIVHCSPSITFTGPSTADLYDCNAPAGTPGNSLQVPLPLARLTPLPERTGGCRYGHLYSSLAGITSFIFFQEYAVGTLGQYLPAGCYTASVWVSKGDALSVAPGNIAADNILTMELIRNRVASSCTLQTKQVMVTTSINNLGWVQRTASFTITPAEAGLFKYVKLTAPHSPWPGHISSILFDDVEITKNPVTAPQIAVSANPAAICSGESTTLTATGGTSYVWSGPGINGQTGNQVTVSPQVTTTYTVSGSHTCSGPFSVLASVTVDVSDAPNFTLGPDQFLCYADPIPQLCPSVYKKGDSYSWTGPLLPFGGTTTPCIQPFAPGVYCLTVTNFAGCSTTDCVTINIGPNLNYSPIFKLETRCVTGSSTVDVEARYDPFPVGYTQRFLVDLVVGGVYIQQGPGYLVPSSNSFVIPFPFAQGQLYRIRRQVWHSDPCYGLRTDEHSFNCLAMKTEGEEEERERKATYVEDKDQDLSQENSFSVFPNPNSGQFNISLGEPEEEATITILNSMGSVVLEKTIRSTNVAELNIESQPSGFYFVRITSGNNVRVQKIIKN